MWGVFGALVESTLFVRRVMGSTPALAATQGLWRSYILFVATIIYSICFQISHFLYFFTATYFLKYFSYLNST